MRVFQLMRELANSDYCARRRQPAILRSADKGLSQKLTGDSKETVAIRPFRSLRGFECFYEKVIKVKADVAALLTFLVLCGFRHISAENFALGSLRSDDWQLGRPTAAPLLSVSRVISPPNASSLPCCIDPVVTGGAVKGARKGRSSCPLTAPPVTSSSSWERSTTQFS